MEAGAHLVKRCEVRQASHVSDPACVHNGRPDEIDQLRFNEMLAIPDGIEDLAHRKWSHRMLANKLEGALVLRRCRILQPEQTIGLQVSREPRCLDRRQPMMNVM